MKISKILLFCLVVLFLDVDATQAQTLLRSEFFFPQIVDGKIDEDDEWRTIIVLSNPSVTPPATATVTLTIVRQDGSAVTADEMEFRCLEKFCWSLHIHRAAYRARIADRH